MAVNVTYPGVYIEELTSPVRTITGVSTAVAAFVGPSVRGPVDRPRHIGSWSDFVRVYGGLADRSLMSYAVLHYFQNGGAEAEVVRVAATARAARIELGGEVTLQARVPGAAGNDLLACVEHPDDTATYVLKVKQKDKVTSYVVTAEAEDGQPGSLADVLGADAPVVPVPGATKGKPPATSPPAAGQDEFAVPDVRHSDGKGRDGATAARIALPEEKQEKAAGAAESKHVGLVARDPGAWGGRLSVKVDHATRDPSPGEEGKLYNLTVRDEGTGAEEVFRNIVADKNSPRSLDRVLQASNLVDVAADTLLDLRPQAKTVIATGGSDGPKIDAVDLAGTSGTGRTGLQLLLDTDLFTILCVPPVDRDVPLPKELLAAAAGLCRQRRSMLLVDAPHEWTDTDKAVAGVDGIRNAVGDDARNTALYFPWVRLGDAHGNLVDFPPCGVVAGVWARTDGQRNVAKAPAGTEAALNGVTEPTVRLTDADSGRLNPLAVNCLRAFPVVGNVSWGARTLRGADRLADQWKYVPVRRTALFIEESLYRGTQWVVFEPNDEPLWSAIRLNVGAFMNSLFRQGMFRGSTPQEAYLVKCDKDNNPQNDIDRGIVNILVGFAPLKPAEFVIIHIQQISSALQV
ncbi:phage tail sheath C-terminal domain-containing protein [Streptomyces chartreusis]